MTDDQKLKAIRDTVIRMVKKSQFKSAKAILASFGVNKVSELQPYQYDAVITSFNLLL